MSKADIKAKYQKESLTLETLLDYVVDLHFEINKLKQKPKQIITKQPLKTQFIPTEIPEISFKQYLQVHIYPNIVAVLDDVFQENIIFGIEQLFKKNKIENMPIYCLNRKPNEFYVYENDEWNMEDSDFMNKIVSNLLYEFSITFNVHWVAKNQQRLLEDSSFYKTYINFKQ